MLKGFICPDGNRVDTEECLAGRCRMKTRCAPLGYLQLCAKQRPWDGKPSVTQLISGTRQQYLMLKHDFDEDPRDCAWKVLGTKSHSGLDDENSLSFTEEKMSWEGITGTTDLVEEQPNGDLWLVDYKVSGSFKVASAIGMVKKEKILLDEAGNERKYKNGKTMKETWYEMDLTRADIRDWQLQLNAYRLFFEKDTGFKITALKIFTVVRDGKTYVADGRGITEPYYYIDVPMLPDEEVEKYFSQKRDLLLLAVNSDTPPPPCSSHETWEGRKCKGYCAVKDRCCELGNPYITSEMPEEGAE